MGENGTAPESWGPIEPLERAAGAALGGAYRAQQAAIRVPLLASHLLLRGVGHTRSRPSPEAAEALQREYGALLERDLQNAEEGLYPRSLLFQIPWRDYAWRLPRFVADLPRVMWRSRRGDWTDLPDTGARRFPAYFRRAFHWQTDGYLSRHSAQLYDLSVEVLFLGCADVMRRQVIPPMVRFARRASGPPLRILDVGCGTGRTLAQIAAALPGQQYHGVDLSPWYLEEARQQLSGVPDVSLLADSAEELPYRDDYFDVVTSVFLFHELPRRVRRRVMSELVRVLRPGGLLVIEDSAQLSEAEDLAPFLRGFGDRMHEPFYRDYLRDDLEALVAGAGLEPRGAERAWLSKVVSAEAPRS